MKRFPVLQWLIQKSSNPPIPKPLGRWGQCGEKKTVSDVLEIKIRQKEYREFLIQHKIDPYYNYQRKSTSMKTEEDPYLPYYVFDS
jgi:hypothetical protein